MNTSVVIIPTYNEKANIERMIRKVFSLEKPFDILIIDDGSPDGTGAIVQQLMDTEFGGKLHLLSRKGKLGLGTAYIAGFNWSLEKGYEYIFEMDADFSHNPDDLLRLHKACAEEGADLAIGSRYITGINVVNWPLGRILMSYGASIYVRIIMGIPVKDTTAGFKCYRRRVLENVNYESIKFKGYGFQIAMKFMTWKLGFKIKEVPIIFTDRKLGVSKMSGGIFSEALWGVMKTRLFSIFCPVKSKKAHAK